MLSGQAAQPDSGAHERHLAAGAIAQQLTMVVGTIVMLAVVTVLGRTLTLAEFGVYGVLVSIPTYMLLAQASVETAVIKAIAQVKEQSERDRAVTTAVALYAGFGLLASLLIVFGGRLLLGVFDISASLREDARLGLDMLGLVNLAGWPAKTSQDVLRGSQRYVPAALAEGIAYLLFGIVMTAVLVVGAPLWVIAGIGGSLPLLIGLAAGGILLRLRLGYRLRPSTLSLPYTREFLSVSAYLFITGIADLVIYSFDRTVLGAFRPVATVGLYEGPVRAHNLIRQLQGTLVLTVMPAAAAYVASGDRARLRDLLLRGTRYVMLATVPLVVTFMVLSRPILQVWLGPRFDPAATAMTILVSYWLVGAASGVGGTMLIAAGHVRLVAIFISSVAVFSLALSLALTPALGLDGVVLGTAIPNATMTPIIIWIYCRTFEVSVRSLWRDALMPAYLGGAGLALLEALAERWFALDHALVLLAVLACGIGLYGITVYSVWLRPSERVLLRTLLAGVRRRLALMRPAYRTL